MRFLPSMAALAVTAGLAGSAAAQMPFPFGGPQMPEPGKAPPCTKEYVKSVEAQISAMQKLRASGPEFVGQFCSLMQQKGADIVLTAGAEGFYADQKFHGPAGPVVKLFTHFLLDVFDFIIAGRFNFFGIIIVHKTFRIVYDMCQQMPFYHPLIKYLYRNDDGGNRRQCAAITFHDVM